MIIVKLICDICGREVTGDKCNEHDEEKLRSAARALGWKRIMGKDVCNECMEEFSDERIDK